MFGTIVWTRSTVRSATRCVAALALMASATLSLPACGSGGGGSDPVLHIATGGLSNGILGAGYSPVQFAAGSATGSTTWSIDSGTLPAGMGMSATGLLQGTPNAVGDFAFVVMVEDDITMATRGYTITVAEFRLQSTSGMIGSEAWTGVPIELESQGDLGPVSFDVVANGSGGALSMINNAAGTVVWTPGLTTGVQDEIRVTDDTSGANVRLTIDVRTNPVPNHVAEFGSSDVWWVNTSIKRGTHAFRTDYMRALSSIGMLPAQAATTEEGIELEDRVAATARRYFLKELNFFYLRNGDGTRGTGLRASFPYFRPVTPPNFTPGPAGIIGAAPNRFNVMELADYATSGSPGVLGRAYLDPGNGSIEHDGGTSGSGNRLGVFVERMTSSFKVWQAGRLLTSDPVTVTDASIVDDMLYDQPVVGPRHSEIDELLTYFSRAFAQVTAHEIAHSIGFEHTGDAGTLMSGTGAGFSDADLGVSNGVKFTTAEIDVMRTSNLPGPNRGGSPRLAEQPGADDAPRPAPIEIELRAVEKR